MANIFIISAPSGSGKSTLVNQVRRSVPGLEFSISYTTRKPRGSEQNGCEYFFVTREQFLPPNRSELEQRLRKRSQDAEEVIQRRLETASREIENYEKYDYILVNDRLDDSVEALKAILLSERLRRSGQADANLSVRAEMFRLDRIRERLRPILESFGEAAASGK